MVRRGLALEKLDFHDEESEDVEHLKNELTYLMECLRRETGMVERQLIYQRSKEIFEQLQRAIGK